MKNNNFILMMAIAIGMLVTSCVKDKEIITPPQQINTSTSIEDGVYIGSWFNEDNTTAIVAFHIKDAQVNQVYVDGNPIANNSSNDYLLIASQTEALNQFNLMVKELDDVRITKTSLTSKDAPTLWIISFTNADKNKIIPGKYIAELPDKTLVYTIAEGGVIDVTILNSNNK